MPRKKSKVATRTLIPEEIEKQFEMISERAKECGIIQVMKLPEWVEYANRYKAALIENNPKIKEIDLRFVVNRGTIAKIVLKHGYWFSKWMTSQSMANRIEKYHYVIHDFLERGLEAVPDEWRKVGEWYDRRCIRPITDSRGIVHYYDITPQMIIFGRDLGKTNCFTSDPLVQRVADDPYSKWYVGQYTLPKAQQILTSIKMKLENPFLSLLFPETFCPAKTEYVDKGGKWNATEVEIVTFSENGIINPRQECTYTAVSPDSATTGGHPNGAYVDDLDNDISDATILETNKCRKWFENLSALAYYPGHFPLRLTDTLYREGCVCDVNKGKCTYARMPLEWFYEGERKFLSMWYPAPVCDKLKIEWGITWQGHACISHIPRDMQKTELGFDRNANIRNISGARFEEMRKALIAVSAGDPSYSTIGKKAGDGKSHATILHTLRDQRTTYIYGFWETMGVENTEAWRDVCVRQVVRNGVEVWTQDAQATQIAQANYVNKAISEATKQACKCYCHTKPSKGKMQVAMSVLHDPIVSREVVVLRIADGPFENVQSMQKVIDQFTGIDKGMDIIDCAVYIVGDIDMNVELPKALYRREYIKRITENPTPSEEFCLTKWQMNRGVR